MSCHRGLVAATAQPFNAQAARRNSAVKPRQPSPMAPILRSLGCTARLLLVVAAVALAGAAMSQTMTETTPLAESVQAGPLLLGDRPLAVTLAAPQGALRERLRGLRDAQV